ncbi:class I SAM-dependent DNA methyltransferase [Cribrihabitans pelagius]|uniref:class I SAM-dependent DNA methyltransferase n=1 Tax=Cribrihabitans pelagius TaxID=1765746 RepID=UPI003B58B51D
MTDDWDDYANGWDGNAAVKLYADHAFACLAARADICNAGWSSKRVLDFGCGTGLLAQIVAPHVNELVAADTSEAMIAVLRGKSIRNVIAVHGDILAADYEDTADLDSGFDLIYASSVCGFLPDYANAVQALARLLKPAGQFIQWDWRASEGGDFGLSENQISNALQAAELRSIQVEQAFSIVSGEQSLPVLIGAGFA